MWKLKHKPRIIIDLGCGPEPWPVYTKRKYRLKKHDRYIGVDYDDCSEERGDYLHFIGFKNAREEIKKYNLKGNYYFINCDYLDQWPFKNESATEVHLHAPQPSPSPNVRKTLEESLKDKFIVPIDLEHFLGECQRVLTPEGRVYITGEEDTTRITDVGVAKYGFRIEHFFGISLYLLTLIPFYEIFADTFDLGNLPFTRSLFIGRPGLYYTILKKDNNISINR